MMTYSISNVSLFIAYRRDILEGEEQYFESVRDMIARTVARCSCAELPIKRSI